MHGCAWIQKLLSVLVQVLLWTMQTSFLLYFISTEQPHVNKFRYEWTRCKKLALFPMMYKWDIEAKVKKDRKTITPPSISH